MEQAAVHASKEIGVATKREEYMDVFRALGIIAMILGHIGFGSRFDHLIHAFHMPMFFFVSGFFFAISISSLLYCYGHPTAPYSW